MTTTPRFRATIDLPRLPEPWLDAVSTALPDLARDIVAQIRTEIPEYGNDPTGEIWAETQRTVHEALRMFLRTLADGGQLRPEYGDLFRRLGRIEADAGRSHDTLQTAYRIASEAVMHQLLDWERKFRAPRDVMAKLSSAVFAFIDHLAALSADGYASARKGTGDDARERALLLGLFVQRGAAAAAPSAQRIGWALPEHCVIVEAVPRIVLDDAELTQLGRDLFGEQALAGWQNGRPLMLVPGQIDVDDLRARLATRTDGLAVAVGPCVPLTEAASSARLAQRAASMPSLRSRDRLVLCEDHLLELLDDVGRDATRALTRRRLDPLLALTPTKRVKYGQLLSAWLEFGSIHGSAPGILDKHRQTLRYQTAQLERMFGDVLHDRRARLELMLALRSVLPEWEREAAARQRTTHRAKVGGRSRATTELVHEVRTLPPRFVGEN